MKVYELINILSDCDPEVEVRIASNYGDRCPVDRWTTIVAPVVKRVDVTKGFIFSDYHQSDIVIADDEDSRFDPNQPESVLLS